MLDAIGRTPLVPLRRMVPAGSAAIWIKLEYQNPSGSYKDRMALSMIEAAERRGQLRAGMTVIECTGGNTGSALAMICAAKGYRFHVISSDAYSAEKLATMRAFGAELEIVPSVGGRVTPDLFPRMFERARELAREPGTYWTDQFRNTDAHAGYEQIGLELLEQLGGAPDAFCGAVGTAGMLMGVARALRRASPGVAIVALEPDGSPILSTGRAGSHRVEGTAAGFVPPLFERSVCSAIRVIAEADARALARRLAAEEGIFAGTSTAMNVLGALELARELGAEKRVATVACDSGLKYLAGDLYAEQLYPLD